MGLKSKPQKYMCCLEHAMRSSAMDGCKNVPWKVKEDTAFLETGAVLYLFSFSRNWMPHL